MGPKSPCKLNMSSEGMGPDKREGEGEGRYNSGGIIVEV